MTINAAAQSTTANETEEQRLIRKIEALQNELKELNKTIIAAKDNPCRVHTLKCLKQAITKDLDNLIDLFPNFKI